MIFIAWARKDWVTSRTAALGKAVAESAWLQIVEQEVPGWWWPAIRFPSSLRNGKKLSRSTSESESSPGHKTNSTIAHRHQGEASLAMRESSDMQPGERPQ